MIKSQSGTNSYQHKRLTRKQRGSFDNTYTNIRAREYSRDRRRRGEDGSGGARLSAVPRSSPSRRLPW